MSHIFPPRQSILLVEDCPEDAEATRRSFQKSGLRNPIIHCENGDEALAYLFEKNPARTSLPIIHQA